MKENGNTVSHALASCQSILTLDSVGLMCTSIAHSIDVVGETEGDGLIDVELVSDWVGDTKSQP